MNKEALLRQLDVIADAPNGVQKLRELVLQLAVRGKLVSQQSSDESAGELLDRIASEMARRSTHRKPLLSDEQLPAEDDMAVPFDIPATWIWTRLDAIGTVNPRNYLADDTNVGFCPMSVLPEAYGGAVVHEVRTWREVKQGYSHFADGDVVVAKITPCFQNGKAAVMRGLQSGAGAGTTELHVFRPVEGTVVPDFVLIFLKSPGFVGGGVQTMTGTAGQQRVSKDYFAWSPFPLPPLDEQHRIVAKVGELLALCDELEVRQQRRAEVRVQLNHSVLHHLTSAANASDLATHWRRMHENFGLIYDTPNTVADLRRAVLQLAVRGQLVHQNPDDGEASSLLESITSERQQLFRQEIISRPKALQAVDPDQTPFPLPSQWAWARIGAVTPYPLQDGDWVESKDQDPAGGVRLIQLADVGEGEYRDRSARFLTGETAARLKCTYLVADDVLIARLPNPLGRACLFPGDPRPSVTVVDVAIARCGLAGPLPHYVMHAINSACVRDQMLAFGTGTTRFRISTGNIATVMIPVPPLAEQVRIVQRVEELMALCDELETRLSRARDSADQLAFSVVNRFAGV